MLDDKKKHYKTLEIFCILFKPFLRGFLESKIFHHFFIFHHACNQSLSVVLTAIQFILFKKYLAKSHKNIDPKLYSFKFCS